MRAGLEGGDFFCAADRARELLGDFPEALAALERFERHASPEVKAKVGRLDELFRELRSRISTLQLSCAQAGARVLVRDKVVGLTPLSASLRLPAGAATLQGELDGFFPVTKEVVLPAGGALPAAETPAPPPPPPLAYGGTKPHRPPRLRD